MSKLSFRKLQGNVDGRDLRETAIRKIFENFGVPKCPSRQPGKFVSLFNEEK